MLICGSGVGASVAAKKLPGIRAGVCHDTYSAHQGVEHDDMNVLVLGARVIGEERRARRWGIFWRRSLRRGAPSAACGKGQTVGAALLEIGIRRTIMNPLKELHDQGQSVWLDYIRRDLIRNGGLKRLVEEDGVSGVTSNPTIFEKAITGSSDYDEALGALLKESQRRTEQLYEPLAIEDIQMAADVLRGHEESAGADGYVSLEVSPYLAHDTQAPSARPSGCALRSPVPTS